MTHLVSDEEIIRSLTAFAQQLDDRTSAQRNVDPLGDRTSDSDIRQSPSHFRSPIDGIDRHRQGVPVPSITGSSGYRKKRQRSSARPSHSADTQRFVKRDEHGSRDRSSDYTTTKYGTVIDRYIPRNTTDESLNRNQHRYQCHAREDVSPRAWNDLNYERSYPDLVRHDQRNIEGVFAQGNSNVQNKKQVTNFWDSVPKGPKVTTHSSRVWTSTHQHVPINLPSTTRSFHDASAPLTHSDNDARVSTLVDIGQKAAPNDVRKQSDSAISLTVRTAAESSMSPSSRPSDSSGESFHVLTLSDEQELVQKPKKGLAEEIEEPMKRVDEASKEMEESVMEPMQQTMIKPVEEPIAVDDMTTPTPKQLHHTMPQVLARRLSSVTSTEDFVMHKALEHSHKTMLKIQASPLINLLVESNHTSTTRSDPEPMQPASQHKASTTRLSHDSVVSLVKGALQDGGTDDTENDTIGEVIYGREEKRDESRFALVNRIDQLERELREAREREKQYLEERERFYSCTAPTKPKSLFRSRQRKRTSTVSRVLMDASDNGRNYFRNHPEEQRLQRTQSPGSAFAAIPEDTVIIDLISDNSEGEPEIDTTESQQASLQQASLQQASLQQASLQQASLQQASLQQASLQQAQKETEDKISLLSVQVCKYQSRNGYLQTLLSLEDESDGYIDDDLRAKCSTAREHLASHIATIKTIEMSIAELQVTLIRQNIALQDFNQTQDESPFSKSCRSHKCADIDGLERLRRSTSVDSAASLYAPPPPRPPQGHKQPLPAYTEPDPDKATTSPFDSAGTDSTRSRQSPKRIERRRSKRLRRD